MINKTTIRTFCDCKPSRAFSLIKVLLVFIKNAEALDKLQDT